MTVLPKEKNMKEKVADDSPVQVENTVNPWDELFLHVLVQREIMFYAYKSSARTLFI